MRHARFVFVLFGFLLLFASPVTALTTEEVAKLLASDGEPNDFFGYSVALDRNVALIGAWGEDENGQKSGAAYIFARDMFGRWTEQAKLLATDGTMWDEFGYSVALDGDIALVGVYGDDHLGPFAGAVCVFERDRFGEWRERSQLLASDRAAWAFFGNSVALDGRTAIVGAYGDDDFGSRSGAAYVFERDASGNWTEQVKLLASDGARGDQFGYAVALDSGTAIVGARGGDDSGWDSGSAYVFRYGSGEWTEQAKLIATDGAQWDYFGSSVALDDGTAIVSAYGDRDCGAWTGSAYVFAREAFGRWTEQAKLVASDAAAGDVFGCAVALDGNTAIIGALGEDDHGSAYVFIRTLGQWTERGKLLASGGAQDSQFAYSLALDGGTAIVGAYWDVERGNFCGSAYVFDLKRYMNFPPRVGGPTSREPGRP